MLIQIKEDIFVCTIGLTRREDTIIANMDSSEIKSVECLYKKIKEFNMKQIIIIPSYRTDCLIYIIQKVS